MPQSTKQDFISAFAGVGKYSGAEIYDFAQSVVEQYDEVTGFQLIQTATGRPTVSFDLPPDVSAFTPYRRDADDQIIGKHGANGVISAKVRIRFPESEALGTSADTAVETLYSSVSIVKGTKRFTSDLGKVQEIAKSGLFKAARPGLVGGGAEEQDAHPAQSFINEVAEEVGNLEGERIDTGQSNEELDAIARDFAGAGWQDRLRPIGKYIDYNQPGSLLLAHAHELEVDGEAFLSILGRANTVEQANRDFLNDTMTRDTWKEAVKETLAINIQDVTQPFDHSLINEVMKKGFPEIEQNELLRKVYLDDSEIPTYAHEEHALSAFREAKAEALRANDQPIAVADVLISPDMVRAYVRENLSEMRQAGKLTPGSEGLDAQLDEQDLQAILDRARAATPPSQVDAITEGNRVGAPEIAEGHIR